MSTRVDRYTRVRLENYNHAKAFAKKALANLSQMVDQLPDVEPALGDQNEAHITWANIGDLTYLNKTLVQAIDWLAEIQGMDSPE